MTSPLDALALALTPALDACDGGKRGGGEPPTLHRLDAARATDTVVSMTTVERLRAVEWPRIMKRMTLYAFKRCRGRSWELAQDVAQAAIAQTLEVGGWDPEKEPIVERAIALRIRGLLANEWKRSRNRFEIAMDAPDDETRASDATGDGVDDRLDAVRHAKDFHARLVDRLNGDASARELVELMMDGLATPIALAEASGRDVASVRESRRRIRYHAEQVAKEMDREMAALEEPMESSS